MGDATTNGTAGAINTGANAIALGSFPDSYTMGNIQLITSDRPQTNLLPQANPLPQIPLASEPPPFSLQPSPTVQLQLLQRQPLQPPKQLSIDLLPPEKKRFDQNSPSASLAATEVDEALVKLEELFTRQVEEYVGKPAETPIFNLADTRLALRKIEVFPGVKPALIYVAFVPRRVAPAAANKKLAVVSSPSSDIQWTFNSQDLAGNWLSDNSNQPENKPKLPIQNPRSDNDQLELIIVTAQSQPIRYRVEGTTRAEVLKFAKQLRTEITKSQRNADYLAPSQKLYQWLISPIEADLKAQGVQNLVFVMDAGLRSLPLAALHDGSSFLIEKYSVGLMPSLSLINTRYTDIKNAQILGMGAEKFTNQNPLPAVPTELKIVTQQLWKGKYLLNEEFTLANLKSARSQQPFGIIHLATHGEFKAGALSNSYLQLWDTQLRLDQLQQLGWNKPPVDLLVLSACRTALGSEEAELGFAGLAVLSGVKSAMGSLWYVSDEGTLGLMVDFYQQLKIAPIKAEALRQAQVAMLKGEVRIKGGKLYTPGGNFDLPPTLVNLRDQELKHPYFWSAFTIIGSPW